MIARLQALAERNIERFGLLAGPETPGERSTDTGAEQHTDASIGPLHALAVSERGPSRAHGERPFAITLDVGSSMANHTGDWRTERPEYVRRLPPCNDACPAGEDIQRWLYEAESGGDGYERPGGRSLREIRCRRSWGASATTRARRPATVPARRGRRHQLGRAVPRRRGDPRRLGAARSPPRRQASACSSSAPDLRASQPPTTSRCAATT